MSVKSNLVHNWLVRLSDRERKALFQLAANELKLQFLDFRNVYQIKQPDINNNNNID